MTGRRLPRLSPRLRRLVLTVHVCVSVAWIGLELVLAVLGAVGLLSDDPQTLRSVYVAAGLLGPAMLIPFGAATLVSGLLLGWGTKWGVLRHWWVAAKLAISVGLLVAVTVVVNGRLREASDRALEGRVEDLGQATLGAVGHPVIGSSAAAVALLVAATALSIYKPWGRLGRPSASSPGTGYSAPHHSQ